MKAPDVVQALVDLKNEIAEKTQDGTSAPLLAASNLIVAAQVSRLCDLLEKPIGDVHFVSQPLDSDNAITLIGKGLMALQQRFGEYIQKNFFDN